MPERASHQAPLRRIHVGRGSRLKRTIILMLLLLLLIVSSRILLLFDEMILILLGLGEQQIRCLLSLQTVLQFKDAQIDRPEFRLALL